MRDADGCRKGGADLAIGFQAEVEPATHEVARSGIARFGFLVAAARAEIASPAGAAVRLCVDVARFNKTAAPFGIETFVRAQFEGRIADGPVTGIPAAIGRHREI